MRKLVVVILFCLATPGFAQTEDDLIRWAEANKPLADSGQISQLEFHRELHRRISIIPASTYPFKLINLKWIGRKVDILEAVEAGTLTPEQGRRRLAEADAEMEQAGAEMEEAETRERTTRARADFDRAEAQRIQQEQAATQAEAQRRALILQMIQNNQARQPYQHQPYQIPVPQQTRCTGQWVGSTWQTVCR